MNFSNRKKHRGRTFFLILFLALIFLWLFSLSLDFSQNQAPIYGVTFSKKYALDLELDWQKTYQAILDDLGVRQLRLIAYWNEIEKNQDNLDFADLDWQIDEAQKRGAEIALVVGRRAPRWPECHDPTWLKNLAPLAIQQQQVEFVKQTIKRYQNNTAITDWQVENEPLFAWFGKCPKPSKKFLLEEILAVRGLDNRPIIITDSGELNHWQSAASFGDILGTTMYRIVWNKQTGFFDYWFLPPAFYKFKADVTKFFHDNIKEIIVTELQMEPWTMDKRMVELSFTDQEKSFDLNRFQKNIEYVQKTGFSKVYLWGVEYWYYLKEKGRPDIWQEAKKLWED
ncbi:MAG TPA: hypothetical protein VJG65_03735 [Patescibacteria group bacterium]|nr:hypothetical protein [Patescibacteria group bacterium]